MGKYQTEYALCLLAYVMIQEAMMLAISNKASFCAWNPYIRVSGDTVRWS